jgi:hypothetical protein
MSNGIAASSISGTRMRHNQPMRHRPIRATRRPLTRFLCDPLRSRTFALLISSIQLPGHGAHEAQLGGVEPGKPWCWVIFDAVLA